jgi:hypothetical protein
LVPEKICSGVRLKGGTASKIWVKTRKIVGSEPLLFKLRSSFYTSRGGGGSEAPLRRMARWGLQVNRHGTFFIKINFNPRVCFCDYFFTQSYRASYVKQILNGG